MVSSKIDERDNQRPSSASNQGSVSEAAFGVGMQKDGATGVELSALSTRYDIYVHEPGDLVLEQAVKRLLLVDDSCCRCGIVTPWNVRGIKTSCLNHCCL